MARSIEAIPRATQQAFFEAQEKAFEFFGGVFRRMRYDNLTLAVRKILRGYQRHQTERFVAFRSHWGFDSEFCNPSRGNEKGGVESEVLPPSSVATRLRAVVQVRKRPGCAPY